MYQSKKPYLYGTGRRKSSVARVHLFPGGDGTITINGRDIDEYFGLDTLKMVVRQPLELTGNTGRVDIVATVAGTHIDDTVFILHHGADHKVEVAHLMPGNTIVVGLIDATTLGADINDTVRIARGILGVVYNISIEDAVRDCERADDAQH